MKHIEITIQSHRRRETQPRSEALEDRLERALGKWVVGNAQPYLGFGTGPGSYSGGLAEFGIEVVRQQLMTWCNQPEVRVAFGADAIAGLRLAVSHMDGDELTILLRELALTHPLPDRAGGLS